MSQEAVNRLMEELCKVVEYFEKEYDLTYAEVIGAFEILKSSLALDCLELQDEGEGEILD